MRIAVRADETAGKRTAACAAIPAGSQSSASAQNPRRTIQFCPSMA